MSLSISLIGDAAIPYALITQRSRAIGVIVPDVTIEEVHRDELVVTDHPVESGASISDHAFKLPVEVEMRVGFSNSTAQSEGYVQAVYEQMVAQQNKREPFDVFTGKRAYQNMLVRSIEVTTDEKSEFALNMTVGLREVIITNTERTSAATQAMPQKTAPVTDRGTIQPQAASDGAAGSSPLNIKVPVTIGGFGHN
jgi:hypothetical protein